MPAERISNGLLDGFFKVLRSKASAIGLRQILPMQTTKILVIKRKASIVVLANDNILPQARLSSCVRVISCPLC